jgi:hypothetical protein
MIKKVMMIQQIKEVYTLGLFKRGTNEFLELPLIYKNEENYKSFHLPLADLNKILYKNFVSSWKLIIIKTVLLNHYIFSRLYITLFQQKLIFCLRIDWLVHIHILPVKIMNKTKYIFAVSLIMI